VMACDTRLAGSSGYDISERHHVSRRLWSPFTTTTASGSSSSSSSKNTLVAPDGSLAVDLLALDEPQATGSTKEDQPALVLLAQETTDEKSSSSYPSVWIGSVGCMTDCEHLKRDLRADLRAAQHFGDIAVSATSATDHAAVALSQTLYSRRGFPYYAFCVCAGIGQVFVYDAVGSYEEVAVACTGTGRSLMQPILDRKFRAARQITTTTNNGVGSIPATVVDCESPEQAVHLLLEGYRSVAEREIGVGDRVVFYTAQRMADTGKCEYKIWTALLKKH